MIGRISTLATILIMCHLVGDYVLQCDYIAKTKGDNQYHLFVHCMLYCLPFMTILEGRQLGLLFFTHIIIDSLKSTLGKITYKQDQILHYIVLVVILVWLI